jgi:hypothetical protein
MKKQILFRLGLCALVCGAVSCGNIFKPSTSVGEQIVNDVDPNLTDINRNVKPFSDSLMCVDSSMRDVNDTFPPWYQYNPYYVIAGRFPGLVTGNGEDVITYLEFRPLILRNDATARPGLHTGIIDSVVFKLRRLRITTRSSASGVPAQIDVDTCPVLVDSTSILARYLARPTDTVPFTRNILKNATKVLGVLPVSTDSAVGDTDLSLKLDSSFYMTKFKNLMKDTVGPSDTAAFAFCLAPDAPGLARFMNIPGDATIPRIIIYYHASALDTSLRTQILYRDHASYTPLEPDSATAGMSPVSSWETYRRALFKIDVSTLANFMDTAAPDNKKYVVIQKADVNIPISQSMSDMRLDSIYVLYKLLDTLATSKNDFNASGNFFIRDSIGINPSTDTSYGIHLASMLQPLIVNHKSRTVYLYLWINGQNSPSGYGPPFTQIAWKPVSKLKLNAIVTNPR